MTFLLNFLHSHAQMTTAIERLVSLRKKPQMRLRRPPPKFLRLTMPTSITQMSPVLKMALQLVALALALETDMAMTVTLMKVQMMMTAKLAMTVTLMQMQMQMKTVTESSSAVLRLTTKMICQSAQPTSATCAAASSRRRRQRTRFA